MDISKLLNDKDTEVWEKTTAFFVKHTIKRHHRQLYSEKCVETLKEWFHENIDHPYPDDEQKKELESKTGLSRSQINNWMSGNRRRFARRFHVTYC